MKTFSVIACAVMLLLLLAIAGNDYAGLADDPNRSLCCICACHSWDERKCVMGCIAMQHDVKIVNEDEMLGCTLACNRAGVAQGPKGGQ